MLANSRKIDSGVASLDTKVEALIKALKKDKQPINEGTSIVDKTPILATLYKTPILATPESSLRVHGENPYKEKSGKSLNPQSSHHHFHPQIELPFFDRSHPREWIRKYDKLFLVYQVEEGQKTDVVEMYLKGKVDISYQSLKLTRGRVSWHELSELIVKRFGEK